MPKFKQLAAEYWDAWITIPIKWHIAYILFAIALGFFISFVLAYLGWL